MQYVFTSCNGNYLDKASILAGSVRRHFPNAKLCVAFSDRHHSSYENTLRQFDHVFYVEDLPHVTAGWIFSHSVVELSTAIKGIVLNILLSRSDCESVLYFDPDVAIFSELPELSQAFANSSILLTPHLTTPEETERGIVDNELCALKHGTYNIGFLGVKNSTVGHEFSDWWSARLISYCYDDIPSGIFTDQRWVDLVPGLFPEVHVLRSERLEADPNHWTAVGVE